MVGTGVVTVTEPPEEPEPDPQPDPDPKPDPDPDPEPNPGPEPDPDPGGDEEPDDTHDPDPGDTDNPDEEPEPDGVEAVIIDPGVLELNAFDTVELTATAFDADGEEMDVSLTWTSSDETVATVTQEGLVTAGGIGGVAFIQASAAEAYGESLITVMPQEPVRVELAPVSVQLGVGQTLQLAATAYSEDDTEAAVDFEFTSSYPSVVTVSDGGLVAGVAVGGPVTVTASFGDLSASSQVNVVAAQDCGVFAAGSSPRLSLARLQVLQVVELGGPGEVPWTRGKETLARAAVRQNSSGPQVRMPATVRVRAMVGNNTIATVTAEQPECIPSSVQLDNLARTFNAEFAASVARKNLKIVAELIDAAGVVKDSAVFDESFYYYFDPKPLRIMFRPVQIGSSGSVPTVDAQHAMSFAREVFPLVSVSATVGPAFVYEGGSGPNNQAQLLLALEGVFAGMDPSLNTYLHGVVPAGTFGGVSGAAFIGRPVAWSALGGNFPLTVAHELGHNFGLMHAPCGSVQNPNPGYPHAGGVTGTYGYRASSGTLYPPTTTYDLMGACTPAWISGRHYYRVADRRSLGTLGLSGIDEGPVPVLRVSGWVEAGGDTVLRPLLLTDANPRLPAPGPWRFVLRDHSGSPLHEVSFDTVDVSTDDLSMFSFSLPMSEAEMMDVGSVHVLDPGGRVAASWTDSATVSLSSADLITAERESAGTATLTWPEASFETLLVIEPDTGYVLGISSTGTIMVETAADQLDVIVSTGLRSNRMSVEIED